MTLLPHTKRKLKFYALRSFIVIVVAAIQIIFFLKGVESVTKDIEETGAKIRGIARLENRKKVLQEEYQEVVHSTILLDNALPSGENPTKFRQVLDDLALRTGNAQSFTFNTDLPNPSELTGISVIPYTVNLTGNLDTFISYLNELQKLNFFIIIDSMGLSGGRAGDFETMTLHSSIYVK